ncbi:uncharacterized protein LOC134541445 isoform X2 [Bacillus rossius redtenbacheri]|uniref:uncharacterized protein LOC134541445 isoform X2 n=1 Tax=Bacillus rossius redtenbacheri TaxID=93214 RepID=UPI002FDD3B21
MWSKFFRRAWCRATPSWASPRPRRAGIGWSKRRGSRAGPSYQLAVSAVRSCPKVGTPLGRLRLLVRTCLAKKCLHAPVEALVRGGSPRGVYDPAGSVLGDEILGEILLSVLLQCGRLAFRLDLANCSFLDASWLPPPVARLEFVPCRSLGVCITFVGGKAIVAAVETNSLAAEDDRIEAGDVLDELNGRHVTTSMRGQLASIMRSGSGKPVTVTVIKACYPGTLSLYPPLVGLLWQARLDPDRVRSGHCRAATEHQDNTCLPAVSAGRAVAYVGSDSTGARGDVREIERAVGAVLAAEAPRRADARLVVVECHEMGVRVLGADDGRVLLKHSYMEISSCGRTSTWPHHFAYIAGEQSCNIAESFTCFVFECRDEEHVDNILHSIGQGFQRTHFAV